MKRPALNLLIDALAFGALACGPAPEVSHGVAAGDVTATRAVIWARADSESRMVVALHPEDRPDEALVRSTPVTAGSDFTGRIVIDGLRPDTPYAYAVRFERGALVWRRAGAPIDGSFRSAPEPGSARRVRVLFGGDLGGQNACRDAVRGYPIFRPMLESAPDVFIGLGDMIYGDNACEATGLYGNAQVAGGFGPAADLAGYRAHWRYNREDAGLRELLSRSAYVGIWDDHEVLNDFGPGGDTRKEPPYQPGAHLLPIGLQAFLEYTPIAGAAPAEAVLYRALRFGRHLEILVLDTRRYRDRNKKPDTPDHPKTLLGAEQRRWLEERLAASDATWKVIVTSVPLSIPTGSDKKRGRDGWADADGETGFESELLGILRFVHERGIRNLLWITTDVHFAAVFRYTPFSDDPGFQFHEVVTGPLNAGLSPTLEFDRTLGSERLFVHGPESREAVRSFDEAQRWFNFGLLDVGETGDVEIRIVNARGETVYTKTLRPSRREAGRSRTRGAAGPRRQKPRRPVPRG